jgi:hypothetical protein
MFFSNVELKNIYKICTQNHDMASVSTYGPCGSSGPWAGLRSGSRVVKRCNKQRGEDIEQHSTKQNSYGLFFFL